LIDPLALALSASTPEGRWPALIHCFDQRAGFTYSERLAAFPWRNEAHFGSLSLQLGARFPQLLRRRCRRRSAGHFMFNGHLHGSPLGLLDQPGLAWRTEIRES